MSSEFWALWSWIWPPFGWTHTTDTAVRPCIHNPHASQSHHQTWRSTEHLFVAVIEDSPINLAPLQVLQIGWKGRRLRQGLSWDTGGGRACCHKVGCCQQEQKHISLHESISMGFCLLTQTFQITHSLSWTVCHLVQFIDSSSSNTADPVKLWNCTRAEWFWLELWNCSVNYHWLKQREWSIISFKWHDHELRP